jgi:hypothetical protein
MPPQRRMNPFWRLAFKVWRLVFTVPGKFDLLKGAGTDGPGKCACPAGLACRQNPCHRQLVGGPGWEDARKHGLRGSCVGKPRRGIDPGTVSRLASGFRPEIQ